KNRYAVKRKSVGAENLSSKNQQQQQQHQSAWEIVETSSKNRATKWGDFEFE
uniref:Uncharacterized protein n=1 Tax=Romanomermis culicivorax TaxID=13658 RepID=A0A915JY54_ROMCU